MTSPQMLGSSPTRSKIQPVRRTGFSSRHNSPLKHNSLLQRCVSARGLAATTLALLLAVPMQAIEIPYDFLVPCTPENAIFGHFSSTKKPVITVKSGAVVRIEGGGGRTGGPNRAAAAAATAKGEALPVLTPEQEIAERNKWFLENNIPLTADSPVVKEVALALKESPHRLPPPPGAPAGTGGGGHFLIGPIYIEGAEPGDSLEVRILDVTPRLPYGSNSASMTGGGLPGVMPRPFSKVYLFDHKRNAAVFDKDVEIPLAPFNGVNGTCPPDSEGPNRRSTEPGVFGGNLDSKDLIAGSTLYLPIFQKGALFYTGDCHAAQGDGEIAGDAIGTANTCTYQFILHKGKTLKGPRAETPSHYIIYGLDPDLDKAMHNAMMGALDFLKEKQGYDLMQAYTLSSAAVDFHVTQVVDKTLGIHAKIAKKLFVNDRDTYWYRTARF
ncbi:MAG: acetamidase/formamidase family protein [Opitutaceae bacterium]